MLFMVNIYCSSEIGGKKVGERKKKDEGEEKTKSIDIRLAPFRRSAK